MWLVTVTWALCISVCATRNCTVVGDDGATYKEEVLATELKWGSEIALKDPNELFINYYNVTLDNRVPGMLDLKTKKFRTIEGPTGSCGFTVDQRHQDIYCWCTNYGGLFKWDSNVRKFVIVTARGETINFAYYANGMLYYTAYVYPKYRAYAFKLGNTSAVPQFSNTQVTELVVDGTGAWVFRKDIGPSPLYRMNPATREQVMFVGSNSTVTLSVSLHGEVYVCDRGGSGAILRANTDPVLRQVVAAPGSSSVTVDTGGNFIYYSWEHEKIIRLSKC